MDIYYAAACQTDFSAPTDRSEIAVRTKRMCEIVEQTIIGYEPFFDVRLLAFPEFAHAVPIYQTVKELRNRLAVPVPNEHTESYARLARKYGCWIQSGTFIESDPQYPDFLFNTTALIGADGVISKYRKVNPWIPWEVHASPHDVPDYDADPFPVADTEIGRIGVAICYDWLFPETIRQIAFNGAEIIVRVSATDFVARLSYEYVELDAAGVGSVDDNGLGLGIGLRFAASDKLELNAGINHVDFSDSGSDTGFEAGGLYSFTDSFSLGLGGDWSDDASAYTLSGRFYFGK